MFRALRDALEQRSLPLPVQLHLEACLQAHMHACGRGHVQDRAFHIRIN